MSAELVDSPTVKAGPAGSRRTRRFVPPTLASLLPEPERGTVAADGAARASGFAEGHAAGWAEGRECGLREGEARARAELQDRVAELSRELENWRARAAVAEALDRLLAARAEDRRALETEGRAAIGAALRTLFPALSARGLGEQVTGLVTEALTAHPADRLEVRAHPETPAAALLRDLAASAPGRIDLAFDAALPRTAIDIRWAEGGLIDDREALLARVIAALDAEATPPEPPSSGREET